MIPHSHTHTQPHTHSHTHTATHTSNGHVQVRDVCTKLYHLINWQTSFLNKTDVYFLPNKTLHFLAFSFFLGNLSWLKRASVSKKYHNFRSYYVRKYCLHKELWYQEIDTDSENQPQFTHVWLTTDTVNVNISHREEAQNQTSEKISHFCVKPKCSPVWAPR